MILVTGSSGFVGNAVVAHIEKQGLKSRQISRNQNDCNNPNTHFIPSIDERTDWGPALSGVEAVIHCAARAHRMNEAGDSFEKYANVNTAGAVKLAESCIEHGVRKLVYVSTIKLCAESTLPGEIIRPDHPLSPSDDYSKTKAAAETRLQQLANDSALELVIVRPPLVYGPGAKGNLEKLVKIVRKGLPLPLGAINNRRSIVGLQNLADFLVLATHHQNAAGQIFNISDGDTVSTTELLETLSVAMGKRSLLIPVPVALIQLAGRLTGMTAQVDRLTSSLEVDSSSCFELLDWQPPLSARESIASLVEDNINRT